MKEKYTVLSSGESPPSATFEALADGKEKFACFGDWSSRSRASLPKGTSSATGMPGKRMGPPGPPPSRTRTEAKGRGSRTLVNSESGNSGWQDEQDPKPAAGQLCPGGCNLLTLKYPGYCCMKCKGKTLDDDGNIFHGKQCDGTFPQGVKNTEAEEPKPDDGEPAVPEPDATAQDQVAEAQDDGADGREESSETPGGPPTDSVALPHLTDRKGRLREGKKGDWVVIRGLSLPKFECLNDLEGMIEIPLGECKNPERIGIRIYDRENLGCTMEKLYTMKPTNLYWIPESTYVPPEESRPAYTVSLEDEEDDGPRDAL